MQILRHRITLFCVVDTTRTFYLTFGGGVTSEWDGALCELSYEDARKHLRYLENHPIFGVYKWVVRDGVMEYGGPLPMFETPKIPEKQSFWRRLWNNKK